MIGVLRGIKRGLRAGRARHTCRNITLSYFTEAKDQNVVHEKKYDVSFNRRRAYLMTEVQKGGSVRQEC